MSAADDTGAAAPADTGEAGFRHIGKPLPRREDRRLLAGTARFLDDMTVPRCLSA
jgi:hypothetical protein